MNKFLIVIPVYNSVKYIEKSILSVMEQNYNNFEVVVVDDCSTDGTYDIIKKYSNHLTIRRNTIRLGSASGNIAYAVKTFSSSSEDIIVTLDGDDWLAHEKVISYLDDIYKDPNVYMTYGQYSPLSGVYKNYCKPIPDTRTYRKSGEWFASHLRTFKSKLWNKINDDDLKDDKGNYYRVAGDASWLYPMVEMCGNKHCKFIDEVLYIYNDLNPENVMKRNVKEQLRIAEYIRSKKEYDELIGGI